MRLIIIRHAQTPWTITGQHTGVTNLPLTEIGRQQAKSLEPLIRLLLEGKAPTVYVSPRRRALETAELALATTPITIDDRIAEFDYGEYEGMTYDQINDRAPGWSIWSDGCPGGESITDVQDRVDAFAKENLDDAMDPVVLITHGHLSRILTARVLGLPASNGAIFDSVPASISLITERRGVRNLKLWNATVSLLENC